MRREFTRIIHFVLDELLPPVIRDRKIFSGLLLRLALGKQSNLIRDFKSRLPGMDKDEMAEYYRQASAAHIERDTDLNQLCIDRILEETRGATVLDIACGTGFLSQKLAENQKVTGADFVLPEDIQSNFPSIEWDEVDLTKLPYENKAFDTVVCTHTLEHVIDLPQAISELRRVCRERLIIVLPCQRPYQYSFDLHIHFFRYDWQVDNVLRRSRASPNHELTKLGGDWYYREDFAKD